MAKRKRNRRRTFGRIDHPKASRADPGRKRAINVRVHVWRSVYVRSPHNAGYCATAAVKGFTTRRGTKHAKFAPITCAKTPTAAFKAALGQLAKKVR